MINSVCVQLGGIIVTRLVGGFVQGSEEKYNNPLKDERVVRDLEKMP